MNDRQLLRQYAENGSQAAFGQLVERHMKMVYWICRRDVKDAHLAEDAAQTVFVLLARKAKALAPSVSVSGWLFTTARLVSKDVLRSEGRQRRLAQEAAMNWQLPAAREACWDSIEPWLNDGLSHLSAGDREALLLRYFEDMSPGEIAQATGSTEPAARMRLSRAIDRLRRYLLKKEVAVAPAILAALLAEHAAKGAPVDCQAATAHALHHASTSPALPALNPLLAKGLLIVSTTKMVTISATAAILLLALLFIGEHRLRSSLGWGMPADGHIATRYRVTQIAPPPGFPHIWAFQLNNKGEAIGTAASADRSLRRPFYYYQGVSIVIPPPNGYDHFSVDQITDQGTIWGYTFQRPSVFLRGTKDGLQPYMPLPKGGRGSNLKVVTDAGTIVCAQHSGLNTYTLSTYANGTFLPIKTFTHCSELTVYQVNTRGDVFGSFTSSDTGVQQGFLWSGGKLAALPIPGGTTSIDGTVLSQAGYVAGQAYKTRNPDDPPVPWLYGHGNLQVLDTPRGYLGSTANSVNDAGVAVGNVWSKKEMRAVIFVSGRTIDLNHLIDPSAGVLLETSWSINDAGEILCLGERAGNFTSFLLTPESALSKGKKS